MSKEIGKEFMKKTQFQFLQRPDQCKGLLPPPIELEHKTKDITINLPAPTEINCDDIALREAILQRRSVRKYLNQSLTLMELSWLLWCTQGVKEVRNRYKTSVTLRNVPSAGARHAFETFLLVNDVETLQPGLYKFLAIDHQLAVVDLEDSLISEKLAEACLKQSHVKKSAVTFFWIAVVYRMIYRYGERGYRYLHLDAGHVCQNLYLAAESVSCGVCAIGAFDDNKVNELIGVDGEGQFTIYIATVGKRLSK